MINVWIWLLLATFLGAAQVPNGEEEEEEEIMGFGGPLPING